MRKQNLSNLSKYRQRKRISPILNQFFLIWCFFLFLLLSLAFIKGDKGYLRLRQLNQKHNELKKQNENITGENKRLVKEIKDLKENPDYIERLAREELGLAKKGEIVFHIIPIGDNKD